MGGQWWRDGVVYQVYVRSFGDSDGDGVGDLAGVTGRLDYLVDLGVDALWLTPIYASPMRDGGYDIADYRAVDPLFGDLHAFDNLVQQAHARGLRVVLDWVPNHTSDQHAWFRASRARRDDPRRSWYVWADGRPGNPPSGARHRDAPGAPPNNWHSAFDGVGPAWTYDPATGQWYLHSFAPEQPDLNWDEPEVREAMADVLRFWLDRGVDGFRVDVAQCLGKDPQLRDNPSVITKPTAETAGRRHDEDWPSVFAHLAAIRAALDEHAAQQAAADGASDPLLVGEVYVRSQPRLAEYVIGGDGLHLAHNFVFLHQPWQARAFQDTVDEFDVLSGDTAWPAWFLNNHDHPRVASRYDRDDGAGAGSGQARARLAAMMLLTLRGTPFLYQGEELGLPDARIPADAAVDVDGRDGVRVPLPWQPPSQAGPGAGFTTGRPWLPIHPDAERLNVVAQTGDACSMLTLYQRLLAYRRRSPALRRGTYRSLDVGDGIYAYLREHDRRRQLVVLNFTAGPVTLQRHPGLPTTAWMALSTRHDRGPAHVDPSSLALAADEGVVLELP